MTYESEVEIASELRAGVWLAIRRMSFGRRLELARRIRGLGQALEYHEAGSSLREQVEAGVLRAEIERVYLEWGLKEVRGLEIDGEPATVERLMASGPEDLVREALAAIKAECGLSTEESKNSRSPSSSST